MLRLRQRDDKPLQRRVKKQALQDTHRGRSVRDVFSCKSRYFLIVSNSYEYVDIHTYIYICVCVHVCVCQVTHTHIYIYMDI